MKKTLSILTFLLFSTFISFTQTTPSYTVEVSNDSILSGNTFEVKFILKNGQGNNFQMPEFNDFNIVGGPNQSSSFSMINGEVSQSSSYSFFLEPKDIGNFHIEPSSIEVEGAILETAPVEIIVVPNPDGIIQSPNKRNRSYDSDFFRRDFNFEQPQTPTPPAQPKRKKRKTYRL